VTYFSGTRYLTSLTIGTTVESHSRRIGARDFHLCIDVSQVLIEEKMCETTEADANSKQKTKIGFKVPNDRQTDRQTRRRTLFYNIYRCYIVRTYITNATFGILMK
jgi:hypothetical protein